MADKNTVKERILNEIEKIDTKKNQIFFFVIDTKGNPSGSLEYIYKLAYIINENGYDVTMLYQVGKDEEFVGVKDWLGEKYANLPHSSIDDGSVNVSPSDILFIPEIYANVMVQTKKLPCKRVAILQNYDYLVEQMPFSVQWGDLNILDCITNTVGNEKLIKDIFPYVKTKVITPYIDEMFGQTSEPKKMIINIVARDQSDINKIVKPFYWKYPVYKWVSFRDLRGLSKQEFSNALREAEMTIWVDTDSSFGYTPLEAMKSGNIVIAKMCEKELPWIYDGENYNDSCIWFGSFNDAHKIIASVIRSIITDVVPEKVNEDAKKVVSEYTKERTEKEIIDYITDLISKRRTEIESLLNKLPNE